MSKSVITRIFIGGVVATLAGIVLAVIALLAAVAGGVVIWDGSEVVGLNGGTLAWTLVLLVIGVLAIGGGFIAGLVSWIGALLNTAQLEDKAWFALLLVLGLFSFGLLAMIAYVIAGPDGISQPVARTETLPATHA